MRENRLAWMRGLYATEVGKAGSSRGVIAAMARKIGCEPKYLQQILGGFKGQKDARPRTPGEKVCRRAEEAYGLPVNAMDGPPPQEDRNDVDTGGPAFNKFDDVGARAVTHGASHHELSLLVQRGVAANALAIPIFDSEGGMGHGRPQLESETIAGGLMLTREWVRTHLPTVSAPHKLSVITGYGDSMDPTFRDGDLLLVDRNVTELRVDAVYVLSLDGELYIKRLQRQPNGGALMLSDNPTYRPIEIKDVARSGLRVLGRVVWAWNGRKL